MISGTVTDAWAASSRARRSRRSGIPVRQPRPLSRAQLRARRGAGCVRTSRSWRRRPRCSSACTERGTAQPDERDGFDETPEITSSLLREFADAGFVNIAGGCCGTTPDHIRAIALRIEGVAPRPCRRCRSRCAFPASEPVTIADDSLFVNVGERTTSPARRRRAADPERAVRGSRERRAPAGPRTARRSSTSTWTRRCSTRPRR